MQKQDQAFSFPIYEVRKLMACLSTDVSLRESCYELEVLAR